MKKRILHTGIILFFVSACLYGQSRLVFDAGTIIHIAAGCDLCADSVSINGTHTGNGTVCGVLVPVSSTGTVIPEFYLLEQNYPNPFNPITNISFSLPENAHVKLTVYDVTGCEIAVIVNEDKLAGFYSISLSLSGLPSGVYFYKLEAGEFVDVKKMSLIK